MEKILVHTRCGLGDQIICNGMINHWSKTKFVYLAARPPTIKTLECLYKDNAHVEIHPLICQQLGPEHEEEIAELSQKLQAESIGLSTHDITAHLYQECMYDPNMMKFMNGVIYDWAHVPFEYRYSKFQLPNEIPRRQEIYNKLKPNKKYALISDRGSSGLNDIDWDQHIDPNLDRLFFEPITDNLLDWIDLIMEAEEIHCIASAPFHLVDSIWSEVKGRKFFHNSRISTYFDPNNEYNQHCWTIIDYEDKLNV
jgi:hypothetical protein